MGFYFIQSQIQWVDITLDSGLDLSFALKYQIKGSLKSHFDFNDLFIYSCGRRNEGSPVIENHCSAKPKMF